MLPGIGLPELIIIAVFGLFLIGVPIAVVILVVYLIRKQGSSRVAELEAENESLRRQLEQHGLK